MLDLPIGSQVEIILISREEKCLLEGKTSFQVLITRSMCDSIPLKEPYVLIMVSGQISEDYVRTVVL